MCSLLRPELPQNMHLPGAFRLARFGVLVMGKTSDDQYSEEETQRRFQALVKAALNTPPEHKTAAPAKKPARKPKEKRS